MSRSIFGTAALVTLIGFASGSAEAQVVYPYSSLYSPVAVYSPAVVYPSPVLVAPRPVVAAAYAYPAPVAYVPQPVVQMAYAAPAVVAAPAPAYVASVPVVAAGGPVRTRVHSGPFNYTETVRAYGPTYGPHYARVHVHYGLFGTTVRERIR